MSKLLARWRQEELAAENAEKVRKALLESTGAKTTAAPQAPRSAAADPDRLRGLPAIGRSVTGAIPGTIPHLHGLGKAPE